MFLHLRYEGMPYSVIESMALSTPSVLTNVDGNRDLVIDKKSGFWWRLMMMWKWQIKLLVF